MITEHRIWHYSAFGDTTGLKKETLEASVKAFLKEEDEFSALGCLAAFEEVTYPMSVEEKKWLYTQRAECYQRLAKIHRHTIHEDAYKCSAREALKQVEALEEQASIDAPHSRPMP